jgi:hypothetical protein
MLSRDALWDLHWLGPDVVLNPVVFMLHSSLEYGTSFYLEVCILPSLSLSRVP